MKKNLKFYVDIWENFLLSSELKFANWKCWVWYLDVVLMIKIVVLLSVSQIL